VLHPAPGVLIEKHITYSMKSSRPSVRLSAVLLAAFAAASASAEEVIVGALLTSVEVYHNQTGPASTTVRYYNAFDEAFELGVTTLSVRIDGGPEEPILSNPVYGGEFKRRQDYATLNDMLSVRPITSTYTYTLDGDPGDTITNTGPAGVSFAQGTPQTPLFTIAGVSGSWSVDGQGRGIFSFDPTGVTSFTVTLNDFVVSATDSDPGEARFEYRYSVKDENAFFETVGEGGAFITTLDDYVAPELTFIAGTAANSDLDPQSFGFESGSAISLEGEFFNHFNVNIDAEGYLNSFVFGNVTSFTLVAIPEPAAFAHLAGLGALVGVLTRRRRAGRG
jgi:hypothetical protein